MNEEEGDVYYQAEDSDEIDDPTDTELEDVAVEIAKQTLHSPFAVMIDKIRRGRIARSTFRAL
jgi:hypothetical protein